MRTWPQAIRAGLVSGACASLASTLVLARAGRRELGSAATPLNGPSQWVWGREAPYADGFSFRHTVVGYVVHHLAATFWAIPYEKWRAARYPVASVAAATVIANVVDFRLTPERLKPGFQNRLSRPSIGIAYVAVALGLLAGGALNAAQSSRAR